MNSYFDEHIVYIYNSETGNKFMLYIINSAKM